MSSELVGCIAQEVRASERDLARGILPSVVPVHHIGLLDNPKGLVTPDDLDRIVALSSQHKDALYVVKPGKDPCPMRFRDSSELDEFVARWKATVMYSYAQRFIDALDLLCHDIEEASGGVPNFGTVFVTPPTQQGLSVHWDRGFVAVMQLFGRKRWRIYEPVTSVVSVLTVPRNLMAAELTAPPVAEVVLSPGDVLMIPFGWPHGAATEGDEPSCHLSVAMFHGSFGY